MRVSRWRVFIQPFVDDGTRGDWVEVTDDILESSLTTVSQDLDNTDYDVGIYRNANMTITVRNDHGRFSDVDVLQSIFRYKREGSLVKVTWEFSDEPATAGVSETGDAWLSEEKTVFIGVLSDEAVTMDLEKQQVRFQVLGRDAIMERMKVPYGSISNGNLISQIIWTCVNDSRLSDVLTVLQANISVGTDVAVDDVSSFQNRTVRQALNDLLLVSNSVLWIDGDILRVTPRTAGVSVAETFYGQGSALGPENILKLANIRTGTSRTFNLWTWAETALSAEQTESQLKFGVRRKELEIKFVTNNTSRQTVLNNLRDEFAWPKIELELTTPLSYEALDLKLLDRVAIDYPIVYQSDQELPICGIAICGEAVLPRALWSFEIDANRPFKVIGKTIDARASTVRLKLREI